MMLSFEGLIFITALRHTNSLIGPFIITIRILTGEIK